MLSQVQYGRGGSAKVVILIALVILVAGLVGVFPLLFSSVGMFGGPKGAYRVAHVRIWADVSAIKLALNRYKSIKGYYPTTEQGLAALVSQRTSICAQARSTQTPSTSTQPVQIASRTLPMMIGDCRWSGVSR